MSGICAVWRAGNPNRTAQTLTAMVAGLSLTGKEEPAWKTDGGAGVGASTRFATQQIYGNDRVNVACDADLLNVDELRACVEENALAGDWGAASLLANLYERFGAAFVERLRGGFSFVLWDRRERKLLAAVDGVGMKRLVYHHYGSLLLIASRIDALMQTGEVDRGINPRAIVNVLNFCVSLAPETIFNGVQRLQPGTLLLATDGNVCLRQYWDMRYGLGGSSNEATLSRQLEDVVEQAVRTSCQGRPFAEVGAFLSGGTDSSTIVGMMARTGAEPVKTFSIGFQEEPFNELEYAELVAKKFGAEHHTYLVGADDCFGALPDMVRTFDEPFANSSAIATYFCARLAAQNGVRLLLGGDGGDELFGGNAWYASDHVFDLYQAVPAALRKGLIEPVLAAIPLQNGLVRKARNYVRRANMPALERVLSYQFLSAHAPATVFEPDFLKTLNGYSVIEVPRRYYEQASARDHLDRMLYADVKIVLGDSDLPKVSYMTELAGVQARFPFLDRSVAEFSGCIPPGLKVRGFEKRYLFKRAFRNLLPAEIIKKKKHGFGIPVSTWLKTDPCLRDFSRDVLFSSRAFQRGYFQREFFEDLFRKFEADDSAYYGDTIWTFFVLELWHRQFVDAPVRVAV